MTRRTRDRTLAGLLAIAAMLVAAALVAGARTPDDAPLGFSF
jgi:hypothetical protein